MGARRRRCVPTSRRLQPRRGWGGGGNCWGSEGGINVVVEGGEEVAAGLAEGDGVERGQTCWGLISGLAQDEEGD